MKIENKYFFDILKLLGGNIFSQIIQFVGTFILVLFFAKEDFGLLSLVISISAVFEIAAGLQLSTAAIINNNRIQALQLMSISMVLTVLISMVLFLGLGLIYCFYPQLINTTLSQLVFLMPFFIISSSLFNNGILMLKYFGKINALNIFRLLYTIITLGCKFFAAYYFVTAKGLVISHLVGMAIVGFIFIFYYRKQIIKILKEVNVKKAIQLIKLNKRFPRYSILSGIINALSNISFPILITAFFGLHENGIYYLVTVFIFQPLLLVLQAVNDAFLPKVKHMFFNDRTALLHFIKAQQMLILKGLIPFLVLASLSGEFLFKYFLKASWLEVGSFIKFQVIYYLFVSIYTPFSIIADFMQQQHFLILFNISLFVSQFIVLISLHNKLNFNFVILITSIVAGLHFWGINTYMMNKLKFYK